MNHVDIILAFPLAIGAIKGFSRGFFLEIASVIGLVVGVMLAAAFADYLGGVISGYMEWSQHTIKIIAFVVIFLLVIIAVKFIARVLQNFLKMLGLNFLNRIAGLGAGVFKVAFLLSVVLIFFDYINRNEIVMSEETRENSFLYKPVSALVPSMLPKGNFINAEETINTFRRSKQEE